MACRIIVSAPVLFPFLWPLALDLGFWTWILDLDFGSGFGTWIRTGLGLDNKLVLVAAPITDSQTDTHAAALYIQYTDYFNIFIFSCL